MTTSTTQRPVGPAPVTLERTLDDWQSMATQAFEAADQPAPTVLRALRWNEVCGPWPWSQRNFRPVIEAALTRARSR